MVAQKAEKGVVVQDVKVSKGVEKWWWRWRMLWWHKGVDMGE